ncbi:UNC93-like protein [Phthorimaea operculella]|nr:UNC93-like protein [Phthorimaea operculella]
MDLKEKSMETTGVNNDEKRVKISQNIVVIKGNGDKVPELLSTKVPGDYKPSERLRIIKNVIVIGLAFMVHFTAYTGAASLQSSINAEKGLGTASLAAVYAGLIISSIFLPAVLIKWLGTKWTICLSLVMYMPYIGTQLYPRFWTMVPAGFIMGLGGGPLWCSKCIYITEVSNVFSKISSHTAEVLIARFLGVFFTIYQSSQLWGNLISSLVLSSSDNKAAVTKLNASEIPLLCGANFLPNHDSGKALQHQPPEKIQLLVGIFLACMAGAVLIVAFIADSTKRYTSGRPGTGLSGFSLLAVTFKLLSEPNQLLMIVPSMFIGCAQGFFTSDFTSAFVSCNIGTGTVGFVAMTHGIADVFGCASTSYIAKKTGRVPLLATAGVIHGSLLITLLSWPPQAGAAYVSFVIALLWGLCNSIFLVQFNAYNGILFPGREEAAFSNFRLWDSIGHIIAYITSAYLRAWVKIYLQLGLLVIGMCCYFTAEYREKKRRSVLKFEKNGVDNVAFE